MVNWTISSRTSSIFFTNILVGQRSHTSKNICPHTWSTYTSKLVPVLVNKPGNSQIKKLLHEKLLQFDWLRALVFQLNLKYLHVKITNLLRVVVKQIITWFLRDIWHKYHSWYFKIVSNSTRLTAREITFNNFEISLVVFMSNITTNHAIQTPLKFDIHFYKWLFWVIFKSWHKDELKISRNPNSID